MSTALRSARLAAPIAAALALAGCGGSMDSIGSSLLAGTSVTPEKIDEAALRAQPTCPIVEIRSGTESLPLYEAGKQGKDDGLRFQINVQRVARECNIVGDNMVVRVGAAGRVAAGPRGTAGTVNVPVRIAAVKDDQVLYSKLHTTGVTVGAPDFSALWTAVDDNVVLPANVTSQVTIYVGLDDKPEKPAPRKKK